MLSQDITDTIGSPYGTDLVDGLMKEQISSVCGKENQRGLWQNLPQPKSFPLGMSESHQHIRMCFQHAQLNQTSECHIEE